MPRDVYQALAEDGVQGLASFIADAGRDAVQLRAALDDARAQVAGLAARVQSMEVDAARVDSLARRVDAVESKLSPVVNAGGVP